MRPFLSKADFSHITARVRPGHAMKKEVLGWSWQRQSHVEAWTAEHHRNVQFSDVWPRRAQMVWPSFPRVRSLSETNSLDLYGYVPWHFPTAQKGNRLPWDAEVVGNQPIADMTYRCTIDEGIALDTTIMSNTFLAIYALQWGLYNISPQIDDVARHSQLGSQTCRVQVDVTCPDPTGILVLTVLLLRTALPPFRHLNAMHS